MITHIFIMSSNHGCSPDWLPLQAGDLLHCGIVLFLIFIPLCKKTNIYINIFKTSSICGWFLKSRSGYAERSNNSKGWVFGKCTNFCSERERGMLLNWNNNGVERELAQEWKTFYSIMPLLHSYSMNKEEFAFRINITKGKMSQTITPFHSLDYFNCLVKVICCSFITKLNNVALVLKCVHC